METEESEGQWVPTDGRLRKPHRKGTLNQDTSDEMGQCDCRSFQTEIRRPKGAEVGTSLTCFRKGGKAYDHRAGTSRLLCASLRGGFRKQAEVMPSRPRRRGGELNSIQT